MNKIKKIFATVIAAATLAITSVSTIAASSVDMNICRISVESTTENTSSISPHADTEPTSPYDLNNGRYIAHIEDLLSGTETSTLYYFLTNTGAFYLHYNLNNGNTGDGQRKFGVTLYKKMLNSWTRVEDTRYIYYNTNGDGKMQFTGLDSNTQYYFRFANGGSGTINGSVEIARSSSEEQTPYSEDSTTSGNYEQIITNESNSISVLQGIFQWFNGLGEISAVFESFPAVVIVILIFYFVRRRYHKHNLGADFKEIRKKARLNEIIRLLLVCWFAELVAVIVLPYGFWYHIWAIILRNYSVVPQEPFVYYFDYTPVLFSCVFESYNPSSREIIQALGNVAIFVPFGFLVPLIYGRINFKRTILTGFSLTFIIEIIHPFMKGRRGDIDDIICNTLGVICGYLLYLLIKRLFPKFADKCRLSVKDLTRT